MMMDEVRMGLNSEAEEEKDQPSNDSNDEFLEALYIEQMRQPSLDHEHIMRNNGFYNQMQPVLEQGIDEEIKLDE